MFKLLTYLKKYTKETILGPLFKLLEATLELLVPLVVAAIIDEGILKGNTSRIVWLSLLMAALGLIGFGFSVTAQYFSARAAVGFTAKVREVLYRHIQGFTYPQLDQIGTSTLITRMTSDMNQVQSAVNLTLRLLLRSPFVVIGAMVMAFTIDVKSALVFALTIPVLSVIVFGIMLLCIPLYKKVQAALDRVLGKTRENLSGVFVLRAFCKEQEEVEEFDARNALLTKTQKFVGRISALMNPLTFAIINGGIILLIYTGALQVEAGILTQGAVVALYNYMSQILVELIKLASLIISITKGVACGNRIQAILELPNGEADRTPQTFADAEGSALAFRKVSFRYEGAAEDSLTDISLTLQHGETLGIIGGTGSGKSTLINLIPRFYDATDGCVLVDGKDVCSYPPTDLRKKIGIVPQKAVLFKGTLRENLLQGNPHATDAELEAAIRIAQGGEILEKSELGLDQPVEQGGKNFSGGQRQRLTIARALVRKPEILILDDSASALDFATDAALRQAIRTLEERPATVIVSQRTSSIAHADKILVLEDGAAVGYGNHEALLESCPVYREIHDSQFKKEARA
ncbi:MAG: ABC transporter ATP-binding protein [Clostridia bacterium]|nr:ABC transporter ATP-binding protein [Clostridia bacterium]